MEDHYVSYAHKDKIIRALVKEVSGNGRVMNSPWVGVSRSGPVGLAIAADELEGMGREYYAVGSKLYDAHNIGSRVEVYQTFNEVPGKAVTLWDDVSDTNTTLDATTGHVEERGLEAQCVVSQVKANSLEEIPERKITSYGEMINPRQWAFYEWKRRENEQSERFRPEKFGGDGTAYQSIDNTTRGLARELRDLLEMYCEFGQKFKIIGVAPRGWLPAVVLSDELGGLCDKVYSVGATPKGAYQVPPGGEGEIALLVDGIPVNDDVTNQAVEALHKEGYTVYQHRVPVGGALPNLVRQKSG